MALINLNGIWMAGENRDHWKEAIVPRLVSDPARMNDGSFWYKRTVKLPQDDFRNAALLLKGARFCPKVYINGDIVSQSEGGMGLTYHKLRHPSIKPGEEITIEIELASLKDVGLDDASRIPEADWWRSNVSSYLWDDVLLSLYGDVRLSRLVPFTDYKSKLLTLHWEVEKPASHCEIKIEAVLTDGQGNIVSQNSKMVTDFKGQINLDLSECAEWSIQFPTLYNLCVRAEYDGMADEYTSSYGYRDFCIVGRGFELNGKSVTLRETSVVWHRWTRDPEAMEIAFDEKWFANNIVDRLKSHGGNTVRFHLGPPPERFLDVCDKAGVMVQLEWSFFHGLKASRESLVRQWHDFFCMALRHPSVVLMHLWNETEGEELEKAFSAIDEICCDLPPFVVSHRDVTHVHKYWWSLFENVGLYYDSAEQFDGPIVVDEFGGNYLDGDCNPGKYPTVAESFLRFLGKNHSKEMRLELHTESNSAVAEYWRRLGVVGFSPFCALGSPEDGNHHFLGPLKFPSPKPVWDALTAAYAPVSVSLEIWDRNFTCGQTADATLYMYNETDESVEISCELYVSDEYTTKRHGLSRVVTDSLLPYERRNIQVSFVLPEVCGKWRLNARMLNRQQGVTHTVLSSWRIRTINPIAHNRLDGKKVFVADDDKELMGFLKENNIQSASDVDSADLIIGGNLLLEKIQSDDRLKEELEKGVDGGKSLLLTNIGPQNLGQGYLENGVLGPLQGGMKVTEPFVKIFELMYGTKVIFKEFPEPESCQHPTEYGTELWTNLDRQSTWLWNGYRGGLNAPASDMYIEGLSREAFLELWQGRGADCDKIITGDYYGYELAGFYSFSNGYSKEEELNLRKRVTFLVEDAPALQNSVNPKGKIQIWNLSAEFANAGRGRAERIRPLVCCGKGLGRSSVVEVSFGKDKGKVVLSQLLTRHRLCRDYAQEGLYGARYDPSAVQLMLNIMAELL